MRSFLSTNNPVSDCAELLFCKAFGWTREENAASGYDAIDEQGTRYLIKARRITPTGPSGQSRRLSAIRNLDNLPFDFLACLLVDEDFQVIRAVLVPVGVVWQLATYVKAEIAAGKAFGHILHCARDEDRPITQS